MVIALSTGKWVRTGLSAYQGARGHFYQGQEWGGALGGALDRIPYTPNGTLPDHHLLPSCCLVSLSSCPLWKVLELNFHSTQSPQATRSC